MLARCRTADFLKHVVHLERHAGDKLTPELHEELQVLLKALIASLGTYRHYCQLFQEHVRGLPVQRSDDNLLFGAGWLLFVTVKGACFLHWNN